MDFCGWVPPLEDPLGPPTLQRVDCCPLGRSPCSLIFASALLFICVDAPAAGSLC
jgi:hypothetical protein